MSRRMLSGLIWIVGIGCLVDWLSGWLRGGKKRGMFIGSCFRVLGGKFHKAYNGPGQW
jgi:hypothetical protein